MPYEGNSERGKRILIGLGILFFFGASLLLAIKLTANTNISMDIRRWARISGEFEGQGETETERSETARSDRENERSGAFPERETAGEPVNAPLSQVKECGAGVSSSQCFISQNRTTGEYIYNWITDPIAGTTMSMTESELREYLNISADKEITFTSGEGKYAPPNPVVVPEVTYSTMDDCLRGGLSRGECAEIVAEQQAYDEQQFTNTIENYQSNPAQFTSEIQEEYYKDCIASGGDSPTCLHDANAISENTATVIEETITYQNTPQNTGDLITDCMSGGRLYQDCAASVEAVTGGAFLENLVGKENLSYSTELQNLENLYVPSQETIWNENYYRNNINLDYLKSRAINANYSDVPSVIENYLTTDLTTLSPMQIVNQLESSTNNINLNSLSPMQIANYVNLANPDDIYQSSYSSYATYMESQGISPEVWSQYFPSENYFSTQYQIHTNPELRKQQTILGAGIFGAGALVGGYFLAAPIVALASSVTAISAPITLTTLLTAAYVQYPGVINQASSFLSTLANDYAFQTGVVEMIEPNSMEYLISDTIDFGSISIKNPLNNDFYQNYVSAKISSLGLSMMLQQIANTGLAGSGMARGVDFIDNFDDTKSAWDCIRGSAADCQETLLNLSIGPADLFELPISGINIALKPFNLKSPTLTSSSEVLINNWKISLKEGGIKEILSSFISGSTPPSPSIINDQIQRNKLNQLQALNKQLNELGTALTSTQKQTEQLRIAGKILETLTLIDSLKEELGIHENRDGTQNITGQEPRFPQQLETEVEEAVTKTNSELTQTGTIVEQAGLDLIVENLTSTESTIDSRDNELPPSLANTISNRLRVLVLQTQISVLKTIEKLVSPTQENDSLTKTEITTTTTDTNVVEENNNQPITYPESETVKITDDTSSNANENESVITSQEDLSSLDRLKLNLVRINPTQPQVTKTLLSNFQLYPNKKVKINDTTFYLTSLYKNPVDNDYVLSIIYSEGSNGVLHSRLIWKSNSSGTWRVAPWIGQIFSKGLYHYVHETKLHPTLSNYLESISNNQMSTLDFAQYEVFSYSLQKNMGLDPVLDYQSEITKYNDMGLLAEFQKYPPGKRFELKSQTFSQIFSSFKYPDGFIPNFNMKPISTSKYIHTLLGEVAVETYQGTLNGNTVNWEMASDNAGRVWIDNIYFSNANISSFGNYSLVLDVGALTNKPLEYRLQATHLTKGEYLNYNLTYVDITPVISQLAPVQQYKNAKSIIFIGGVPINKTITNITSDSDVPNSTNITAIANTSPEKTFVGSLNQQLTSFVSNNINKLTGRYKSAMKIFITFTLTAGLFYLSSPLFSNITNSINYQSLVARNTPTAIVQTVEAPQTILTETVNTLTQNIVTPEVSKEVTPTEVFIPTEQVTNDPYLETAPEIKEDPYLDVVLPKNIFQSNLANADYQQTNDQSNLPLFAEAAEIINPGDMQFSLLAQTVYQQERGDVVNVTNSGMGGISTVDWIIEKNGRTYSPRKGGIFSALYRLDDLRPSDNLLFDAAMWIGLDINTDADSIRNNILLSYHDQNKEIAARSQAFISALILHQYRSEYGIWLAPLQYASGKADNFANQFDSISGSKEESLEIANKVVLDFYRYRWDLPSLYGTKFENVKYKRYESINEYGSNYIGIAIDTTAIINGTPIKIRLDTLQYLMNIEGDYRMGFFDRYNKLVYDYNMGLSDSQVLSPISDQTIKIGIMGDSIAQNISGGISQGIIQKTLDENTDKKYEFVGTQPSFGDGVPNLAFKGITAIDYARQLQNGEIALDPENVPDIVIIQLGTNDLASGIVTNDSDIYNKFIPACEAIAQNLRQVNPSIDILFAPIAETTQSWNALVGPTNTALVDMATRLSKNQGYPNSRIIIINQGTPLFTSSQVSESDGVHPNNSGVRSMADQIGKAIFYTIKGQSEPTSYLLPTRPVQNTPVAQKLTPTMMFSLVPIAENFINIFGTNTQTKTNQQQTTKRSGLIGSGPAQWFEDWSQKYIYDRYPNVSENGTTPKILWESVKTWANDAAVSPTLNALNTIKSDTGHNKTLNEVNNKLENATEQNNTSYDFYRNLATELHQSLLDNNIEPGSQMFVETWDFIDNLNDLAKPNGLKNGLTENQINQDFMFTASGMTSQSFSFRNYGETIASGSYGVVYHDKDTNTATKIFYYPDLPENNYQLLFYYDWGGKAPYITFKGLVTNGFKMEYYPNLMRLDDFIKSGGILTHEEINEAVFNLEQVHNITGTAHGDLYRTFWVSNIAEGLHLGNIQVQILPDGKHRVIILDFAGGNMWQKNQLKGKFKMIMQQKPIDAELTDPNAMKKEYEEFKTRLNNTFYPSIFHKFYREMEKNSLRAMVFMYNFGVDIESRFNNLRH